MSSDRFNRLSREKRASLTSADLESEYPRSDSSPLPVQPPNMMTGGSVWKAPVDLSQQTDELCLESLVREYARRIDFLEGQVEDLKDINKEAQGNLELAVGSIKDAKTLESNYKALQEEIRQLKSRQKVREGELRAEFQAELEAVIGQYEKKLQDTREGASKTLRESQIKKEEETGMVKGQQAFYRATQKLRELVESIVGPSPLHPPLPDSAPLSMLSLQHEALLRCLSLKLPSSSNSYHQPLPQLSASPVSPLLQPSAPSLKLSFDCLLDMHGAEQTRRLVFEETLSLVSMALHDTTLSNVIDRAVEVGQKLGALSNRVEKAQRGLDQLVEEGQVDGGIDDLKRSELLREYRLSLQEKQDQEEKLKEEKRLILIQLDDIGGKYKKLQNDIECLKREKELKNEVLKIKEEVSSMRQSGYSQVVNESVLNSTNNNPTIGYGIQYSSSQQPQFPNSIAQLPTTNPNFFSTAPLPSPQPEKSPQKTQDAQGSSQSTASVQSHSSSFANLKSRLNSMKAKINN